MPLTEKKPLSSNAIKLIAIAAMTVDHIAWAVFPGYPKEFLPLLMHLIGRITCPIMCYCIAEGYHYTRNIRKYTARLFVFALISHFCYIYFSHDFIDWRSFIPFYYGGALNQTSVMWSLAWGLVMLRVAESKKITSGAVRVLLILLICLVSFPRTGAALPRSASWRSARTAASSKSRASGFFSMSRSMRSYISLPSTACTAFCRWALRSRCRFCGSITGSAAKAPP